MYAKTSIAGGGMEVVARREVFDEDPGWGWRYMSITTQHDAMRREKFEREVYHGYGCYVSWILYLTCL